MGCGQSLAIIENSKVDILEYPEKLILQTPEKNLIEKAPGDESKEFQISIKEEAEEKKRTAFDLPVSDFIDGQLGITAEKTIDNIKNRIRPGKLFIDPDFPPNDSSLFFKKQSGNSVTWKRPRELSDKPRLFVEGANRRDVIQGILANCWFLSSCAAVAETSKLIERVIPPDQPLFGDNYRGLIVCHFWRFGEWVTVCIDDFLPTKNNSLIYAKSNDANEFWVALLEKAYAKLHGSYQALEGGQTMDALVDLTGGLSERYDLEHSTKQEREKLFRFLMTASKNNTFITASIKGDWKHSQKADKNGLVAGHAYSISGVAKVKHKEKGSVPIICVRNPWANETEWSGEWGDGDKMWKGVSETDRKRLLRKDTTDGESWMSFIDFWKEFEEISFCSIGPDFDKDGKVDEPGVVKAIKGEWIVGKSAGGSRNNIEKFGKNPQFLLKVKDNEIKSDSVNEDEETKCHVMIGLMQEHRQSRRNSAVKMHQIAFCIYKTDSEFKRLPFTHFLYNYDAANSGIYINYREIICRIELPPGNFVIVPATFEPDTPGFFMLRVYSSSAIELKPLS